MIAIYTCITVGLLKGFDDKARRMYEYTSTMKKKNLEILNFNEFSLMG